MYYLYSCYEEIHRTDGVIIIHIVVVKVARTIHVELVGIGAVEVRRGPRNIAYPNIY